MFSCTAIETLLTILLTGGLTTPEQIYGCPNTVHGMAGVGHLFGPFTDKDWHIYQYLKAFEHQVAEYANENDNAEPDEAQLEAFHLEAVEDAGELQDNRRAVWTRTGEKTGEKTEEDWHEYQYLKAFEHQVAEYANENDNAEPDEAQLEAFHLEAVEDAGELQDNRRAAWTRTGEKTGKLNKGVTKDDRAATLANELIKADSNLSQKDALIKAVDRYSKERKPQRALDGEAKEKKQIQNEKDKEERRRQQKMPTSCPYCSEECGVAGHRSLVNGKFYKHLFDNETCLVSDIVATTTWANLVKNKVLDATQGNPNKKMKKS